MLPAISKLLTLGNDKRLKRYQSTLQAVNDLAPSLQQQSDADLRASADRLRERAASGEALADMLPEAFALVREASSRVIGLRHYDVQLIGAMALNDGCIAEMKTGEGKTLVSTAAGFLNALTGRGVHVVTVNDYLARRDSEWMGKLYNFLGMEVGLIQNGMLPMVRQRSYAASVTYGTNSEFGFDYLRDNMVTRAADRVQRGLQYAIVDEVDSILIDEARTPLIISGLGGQPAGQYQVFAAAVEGLEADADYILDEAKRTIYATERGLDKIEERLGREVYADISGTLANHLRQALRARYLFKRDVDYVVADGQLKIVDEFTGRIMEGRRYSEGLHQALEAKENVEIQAETRTMATITLQNFYRLYDKLAGMTGTALTEDSEFRHIYHLPVVPIPPNKPVARVDEPDFIFRTAEAKYQAVADKVEELHAKGQPVLVGTSSIRNSERLSKLLDERGIPHETLNAKNPEYEASIVAQAGRIGAVTIATNMAGRGTDILLGGNFQALKDDAMQQYGENGALTPEELDAAAEAKARYVVDREGYAVRLFGGLYVIGTDRHESRRIDNQLRGRSGRQGDPGTSRFYLSLEDALLQRFGRDRLHIVSDMMEKRGTDDSEPLCDALVSKVITTAQRQVESMHFSARKNVLEYDDVMNLQRIALYKERNAILDGKGVASNLPAVTHDVVEAQVAQFCPASLPSDDWDVRGMAAWVFAMTGRDDFPLDEAVAQDDADSLAEALEAYLLSIYDEKRAVLGEEAFDEAAAKMMLHLMDTRWIDHLQEMEYLKEGIGLRALGHRDPLVEYKEEAYRAFSDLTDAIYEDFACAVLRMPVEGLQEEMQTLDKDNPFQFDKMTYSNAEAALTEGPDRAVPRVLD